MAIRNRDPRWQVKVVGYYPARTIPKSRRKSKSSTNGFDPPKREIQSFARCILPAIRAYFESDKGRKEFAEWMAQQTEKDKTA
ncbi:MAG: hypothetical protein LBP79_04380 [Clostridiales bacterium]|nr:hypothetical protein [Clostridiales bacterium]